MFKLFALCFSILSLICAIQCTPTVSKRVGPSPKPGSLVSRGHCDFLCPHENVPGRGLSKSSADSGRLYCKYDAEETGDRAYCMYNRVSFIREKILSSVVLTIHSDFPEHRRVAIKLQPFRVRPAGCLPLPRHKERPGRYESGAKSTQRLALRKPSAIRQGTFHGKEGDGGLR